MATTAFTATLLASSTIYETQIWTNFGPLTTAYEAPAICRDDAANIGFVVFSITGTNFTTTSYDCGQANNFLIQDPACYPSSSRVQVFQTVPTDVLWGAYYSPGVSCPSDWSTMESYTYPPATTYTHDQYYDMIGNHDMSATLLMCCPSGFTNGGGFCGSQVQTATSGAMCDINFSCSTGASSVGQTVCPSNANAFSWNPSQTNTLITISAYAILMMRQDSDLPTSITVTTFLTHKTHTTSAHAAGTNDNDSSSSSSAKVLVPAILLPILALITFIATTIWCLRARKRTARKRAEGSYTSSSQQETRVVSGVPS